MIRDGQEEIQIAVSVPEKAAVKAVSPVFLPPAAPASVSTISVADSESHSAKEPNFPRGPEDLREDQFVNKYTSTDINSLLERKPRTSFAGDIKGILFLIDYARIIETHDNREIQLRYWVGHDSHDGIAADSCIGILKPGGAPVVGTAEDGTLTIRDGPIKNSFLAAIGSTDYFLIYDDEVLWNEDRNYNRPAHMTGTLLYFTSQNGKLNYQGRAVRWEDKDHQLHDRMKGISYCRDSFNPSAQER